MRLWRVRNNFEHLLMDSFNQLCKQELTVRRVVQSKVQLQELAKQELEFAHMRNHTYFRHTVASFRDSRNLTSRDYLSKYKDTIGFVVDRYPMFEQWNVSRVGGTYVDEVSLNVPIFKLVVAHHTQNLCSGKMSKKKFQKLRDNKYFNFFHELDSAFEGKSTPCTFREEAQTMRVESKPGQSILYPCDKNSIMMFRHTQLQFGSGFAQMAYEAQQGTIAVNLYTAQFTVDGSKIQFGVDF